MSLESAKAFYSRLKTDEAFEAQLQATENWGQFAREAGYDFTQEEFDAATIQLLESGELSDEALEAVAGGAQMMLIYGGPWRWPW